MTLPKLSTAEILGLVMRLRSVNVMHDSLEHTANYYSTGESRIVGAREDFFQ